MRTCPQCESSCDATHVFCPLCGFPIGKVVPSTKDPLLGRTLPGGYVILELVGIGGMGRVYRAEQTTLGRTVAVKIVHPNLVGEENAAARFITEARAASRLNHPNSVGVIDFGKTQDGQLYLVMEFLRGRDLSRVVYEEGLLAFNRIGSVLKQVLSALSEAHHLQIIHRDLKPENIILEATRAGGDFVKVVDFGLAKMREEAATPSVTSPGIVCGTPEYMSPEQGRGDPLDARSDLYSVGVILYQLVTGRLPFSGDSPTQIVLSHITELPPDPRAVAPERAIPQALVDVILCALEKSPDRRFRDADEFANALLSAVGQGEDRATPLSVPPPMSLASGGPRCPACGHTNPVGQKYCGECGTPIPGRTNEPSDHVPASLTPRTLDRARARLPLPLMARDEELQWLEDRHSEALENVVAFRVVGEPGFGKTRLLREFASLVRAAGDVVVELGPDPLGAEVLLYAARRAVEGLAGLPVGGGPRELWEALEDDVRGGLEVLYAESPKGIAPRTVRSRIARALAWALGRACVRAHGARVVVLIDDMQQVDGASRNAFEDVIAMRLPLPVLVAFAGPGSFRPEWLYFLPTLSLMTLPYEDAFSALGPTLAGTLDPSTELTPLFLEQMVAAHGEQITVPNARVGDLIAARVERLPPEARRVLQVLAVWGEAEDNLLPRLLPEGFDTLGALRSLRRTYLVESLGHSFRVAHPLVREVVLGTIPATARRELHERAAELAESTQRPLEVRAIHEHQARRTFEALLLLDQVGHRCGLYDDIHGSILFLRRALSLAREAMSRGDLDDPEHAVVLFSRKLGSALLQSGAKLDADGVLREALDLCDDTSSERAKLLGLLASVASARERPTEAESYLSMAQTAARKSGAPDVIAWLDGLRYSLILN